MERILHQLIFGKYPIIICRVLYMSGGGGRRISSINSITWFITIRGPPWIIGVWIEKNPLNLIQSLKRYGKGWRLKWIQKTDKNGNFPKCELAVEAEVGRELNEWKFVAFLFQNRHMYIRYIYMYIYIFFFCCQTSTEKKTHCWLFLKRKCWGYEPFRSVGKMIEFLNLRF